MSEPARTTESRRDRLAFVLTLAAVVLAAALVGYVLGQVVFTRWVNVPTGSRTATRPGPETGFPEIARELAQPGPGGPAGGAAAPVAPTPPAGSGAGALPGAPAGPVAEGSPGSSSGRSPAAGPGGSAAPGATAAGEGEARGWFVQVGVFANRDNADRAARAAQSEGYAVRIVPATGSQGATVYKIWIGPYSSREQAVAEREKLKARWPGAFIP